MASWWYLSGDDKKGPFDEKFFPEIIKQESLNAHTQVWTKGFASWTQLSDVPQFVAALTEHEVPPPAPGCIKKNSSIKNILNIKKTERIQLGAITLFAITALSLAFYIGKNPATPDLATQAFNASSGKPLAWTNLETLKSVGITSSYKVEAMLQNGNRWTSMTDTFTNAIMGIGTDVTPDSLDKYVEDLAVNYKKRGQIITQAKFIELHGEKAWEARGFSNNDNKEAYKVVIHKENGRIWITTAIYPTWQDLKGERADFFEQLLETTFM